MRMKKILGYLSLAMLMMVWACEDDNMDPVGNWTITAASPTAPTNNSSLVLNEASPATTTRFEWTAATASNRFIVKYNVLLVEHGSTDYENAIASWTPGDGGRALFVEPTAAQIDYALWAACKAPGEEVQLDWVVVSQAIEQKVMSAQTITIKRFATEYIPTTLFITGEASEHGGALSDAIPMRSIGEGMFETYTHLNAGSTFFFRDQKTTTSRKIGGSDGNLSCGSTIAGPETAGEYRVRANLIDNTYELFKVDRWSLVGDAVEGGWGGDVPLVYVGDGIWEKEIMFYQPYAGAGFAFRANGDWGYLLKREKGTATSDNKGGQLKMENESTPSEIEDVPGTTGLHKVKLDLGATGKNYSLTKVVVVVSAVIGNTADLTANKVTGSFAIDGNMPDKLFLLEDGTKIAEFTKDADVFKTVKYIALQSAKTYSLNSEEDGSGDTFGGDEDGNITVDHDQAYQINVDFTKKELSWNHYNLKLFHWDEDGGGWEQRQEILMTYTHPYKFETTGSLTAGFHSKFISPWDVQFGTDATTLTGTMTNGGNNYKGINATGNYKATIVVTDDFAEANYTFVKQ
jgi:starch-binding outer membrane protein SusE/F